MESQDSSEPVVQRQNLQMTPVFEVRTSENVWKSEDFLDLPEYLRASLLSAAAHRITAARDQKNKVATIMKDKPARTPNLPPEARRPARGRNKSAAAESSRSDQKSRARSFAEILNDARLDSGRNKERPMKSPIGQRTQTGPGRGKGQTVTSKELRMANRPRTVSSKQKQSSKTKSVNSPDRLNKLTKSLVAGVSELDPPATETVSSDLFSSGCINMIFDDPPGDVRQNIVECLEKNSCCYSASINNNIGTMIDDSDHKTNGFFLPSNTEGKCSVNEQLRPPLTAHHTTRSDMKPPEPPGCAAAPTVEDCSGNYRPHLSGVYQRMSNDYTSSTGDDVENLPAKLASFDADSLPLVASSESDNSQRVFIFANIPATNMDIANSRLSNDNDDLRGDVQAVTRTNAVPRTDLCIIAPVDARDNVLTFFIRLERTLMLSYKEPSFDNCYKKTSGDQVDEQTSVIGGAAAVQSPTVSTTSLSDMTVGVVDNDHISVKTVCDLNDCLITVQTSGGDERNDINNIDNIQCVVTEEVECVLLDGRRADANSICKMEQNIDSGRDKGDDPTGQNDHLNQQCVFSKKPVIVTDCLMDYNNDNTNADTFQYIPKISNFMTDDKRWGEDCDGMDWQGGDPNNFNRIANPEGFSEIDSDSYIVQNHFDLDSFENCGKSKSRDDKENLTEISVPDDGRFETSCDHYFVQKYSITCSLDVNNYSITSLPEHPADLIYPNTLDLEVKKEITAYAHGDDEIAKGDSKMIFLNEYSCISFCEKTGVNSNCDNVESDVALDILLDNPCLIDTIDLESDFDNQQRNNVVLSSRDGLTAEGVDATTGRYTIGQDQGKLNIFSDSLNDSIVMLDENGATRLTDSRRSSCDVQLFTTSILPSPLAGLVELPSNNANVLGSLSNGRQDESELLCTDALGRKANSSRQSAETDGVVCPAAGGAVCSSLGGELQLVCLQPSRLYSDTGRPDSDKPIQFLSGYSSGELLTSEMGQEGSKNEGGSCDDITNAATGKRRVLVGRIAQRNAGNDQLKTAQNSRLVGANLEDEFYSNGGSTLRDVNSLPSKEITVGDVSIQGSCKKMVAPDPTAINTAAPTTVSLLNEKAVLLNTEWLQSSKVNCTSHLGDQQENKSVECSTNCTDKSPVGSAEHAMHDFTGEAQTVNCIKKCEANSSEAILIGNAENYLPNMGQQAGKVTLETSVISDGDKTFDDSLSEPVVEESVLSNLDQNTVPGTTGPLDVDGEVGQFASDSNIKIISDINSVDDGLSNSTLDDSLDACKECISGDVGSFANQVVQTNWDFGAHLESFFSSPPAAIIDDKSDRIIVTTVTESENEGNHLRVSPSADQVSAQLSSEERQESVTTTQVLEITEAVRKNYLNNNVENNDDSQATEEPNVDEVSQNICVASDSCGQLDANKVINSSSCMLKNASKDDTHLVNLLIEDGKIAMEVDIKEKISEVDNKIVDDKLFVSEKVEISDRVSAGDLDINLADGHLIISDTVVERLLIGEKEKLLAEENSSLIEDDFVEISKSSVVQTMKKINTSTCSSSVKSASTVCLVDASVCDEDNKTTHLSSHSSKETNSLTERKYKISDGEELTSVDDNTCITSSATEAVDNIAVPCKRSSDISSVNKASPVAGVTCSDGSDPCSYMWYLTTDTDVERASSVSDVGSVAAALQNNFEREPVSGERGGGDEVGELRSDALLQTYRELEKLTDIQAHRYFTGHGYESLSSPAGGGEGGGGGGGYGDTVAVAADCLSAIINNNQLDHDLSNQTAVSVVPVAAADAVMQTSLQEGPAAAGHISDYAAATVSTEERDEVSHAAAISKQSSCISSTARKHFEIKGADEAAVGEPLSYTPAAEGIDDVTQQAMEVMFSEATEDATLGGRVGFMEKHDRQLYGEADVDTCQWRREAPAAAAICISSSDSEIDNLLESVVLMSEYESGVCVGNPPLAMTCMEAVPVAGNAITDAGQVLYCAAESNMAWNTAGLSGQFVSNGYMSELPPAETESGFVSEDLKAEEEKQQHAELDRLLDVYESAGDSSESVQQSDINHMPSAQLIDGLDRQQTASDDVESMDCITFPAASYDLSFLDNLDNSEFNPFVHVSKRSIICSSSKLPLPDVVNDTAFSAPVATDDKQLDVTAHSSSIVGDGHSVIASHSEYLQAEVTSSPDYLNDEQTLSSNQSLCSELQGSVIPESNHSNEVDNAEGLQPVIEYSTEEFSNVTTVSIHMISNLKEVPFAGTDDDNTDSVDDQVSVRMPPFLRYSDTSDFSECEGRKGDHKVSSGEVITDSMSACCQNAKKIDNTENYHAIIDHCNSVISICDKESSCSASVAHNLPYDKSKSVLDRTETSMSASIEGDVCAHKCPRIHSQISQSCNSPVVDDMFDDKLLAAVLAAERNLMQSLCVAQDGSLTENFIQNSQHFDDNNNFANTNSDISHYPECQTVSNEGREFRVCPVHHRHRAAIGRNHLSQQVREFCPDKSEANEGGSGGMKMEQDASLEDSRLLDAMLEAERGVMEILGIGKPPFVS